MPEGTAYDVLKKAALQCVIESAVISALPMQRRAVLQWDGEDVPYTLLSGISKVRMIFIFDFFGFYWWFGLARVFCVSHSDEYMGAF
jgi:hypothetical protein